MVLRFRNSRNFSLDQNKSGACVSRRKPRLRERASGRYICETTSRLLFITARVSAASKITPTMIVPMLMALKATTKELFGSL